MHLPVRCFTCGNCVGALFPAFKLLREKLFTETLHEKPDATPENYVIMGNMPNCDKILDDLGVDKICCRKTMTTAVSMMNYLPH